jgi:hypothetical protein
VEVRHESPTRYVSLDKTRDDVGVPYFMTKSQLIEAMVDYPDNIEIRVEFGINHHVPIEHLDEHHPEGVVGNKENYLLVIIE